MSSPNSAQVGGRETGQDTVGGIVGKVERAEDASNDGGVACNTSMLPCPQPLSEILAAFLCDFLYVWKAFCVGRPIFGNRIAWLTLPASYFPERVASGHVELDEKVDFA